MWSVVTTGSISCGSAWGTYFSTRAADLPCAPAANGHAAAAPPSATNNFRRPMVTVIRPSRARCVKGRIPRHERGVFFTQEQPVRLLHATRVDQPYSGLMLAPRSTLARVAASSGMSFSKSGGEPRNTVPPCSTSRALIMGSVTAALICLLSFSTISGDVLLGAPTPYHVLAS